MFLTKQILNEYEACGPGVEWFERHFPNGAELMDVIRMRHAPASFLHWGRLHLVTSEEERRAYDEVLHITNSTNYWECQNIDHCDMITGSTDVKNSKYIYDSKHITDSKDVTNSDTVQNSTTIFDSTHIYSSTKCAHANNIKNSNNISYSTYVLNSNNVFKSSLITHGSLILNSKNIENSAFVIDSHDCHHCMLCFDIKDAEYQIFNHKINGSQWDFIFTELTDMLATRQLKLFDHWDPEEVGHDARCHIAQNALFSTVLDEPMIHWIKHLPFYDAQMMYRMTFHPSFLE